MISAWLETLDLSSVFIAACLSTVLSTVYVMQITWAESEGKEREWIRWFRRCAQALLAISFLWALNYAYSKAWQPWPPFLGIVIAINLVMLGRIFSIAPRLQEAKRPQHQSTALSWFLGAAAIVAVGAISMALDRVVPYEGGRGEVAEKNLKPGDLMVVRWSGIRRRDCPGTVYRAFQDSKGTMYGVDSISAAYPTAETNLQLVRQLHVPLGMACGPARYLVKTEYYCNPMQRLWPVVTTPAPVLFNVVCP